MSHDETVRRALSDTTPLPIVIAVANAWMLGNALDLASKHPLSSKPQRNAWRDIAWKFHKAIGAAHPEVKPLLGRNVQASEDEWLALAREAMTDEKPLVVALSVSRVWLVITAIQMVDRHPDLAPDGKQRLRQMGLLFQGRIEERHPNATELLNMGWDPAYDVES